MIMTILFPILMIAVFGRLILFAFRMTWGITKVFFNLILLPFILVFAVLNGLMFLAFPLLIIIGIISMVIVH